MFSGNPSLKFVRYFVLIYRGIAFEDGAYMKYEDGKRDMKYKKQKVTGRIEEVKFILFYLFMYV